MVACLRCQPLLQKKVNHHLGLHLSIIYSIYRWGSPVTTVYRHLFLLTLAVRCWIDPDGSAPKPPEKWEFLRNDNDCTVYCALKHSSRRAGSLGSLACFLSLEPFLVKSLVLRSWFKPLLRRSQTLARRARRIDLFNTAAETAKSRFWAMSRLSRLLSPCPLPPKKMQHIPPLYLKHPQTSWVSKRQSYEIRRFGTSKLSCNITKQKHV